LLQWRAIRLGLKYDVSIAYNMIEVTLEIRILIFESSTDGKRMASSPYYAGWMGYTSG
jgi:hypothetical protein